VGRTAGRESTAEREWKTPSDAVAWFAAAGWEVDHQGEVLFRDIRGFPAALHPIRARLRRAYLRHVDRTNRVFSELVIPVVVARWPKKAEKVPVVLTRTGEISSLRPRIEIKPGAMDLFGGASADEKTIGRQVMVKIVEQTTGRRLFASTENVKIEPSGSPVAVALEHTAGQACARGTALRVEVRDADNDELLDHCEVELKVDIEEWD